MALEEVEFLERQIGQLDQEIANLLRPHEDAVKRLAVVPGLGVDSAQQIIAEVDPTAATFPSAKQLSSWVAICPGDDESAGVNHSHRSPKGNRQMRRLLNQAANAAVKMKGCIFQIVYRRLVPRMGHNQAISAIAHRLCRLFGSFCTSRWVMRNEVRRCPQCRDKDALTGWSANYADSVTGSERRAVNPFSWLIQHEEDVIFDPDDTAALIEAKLATCTAADRYSGDYQKIKSYLEDKLVKSKGVNQLLGALRGSELRALMCRIISRALLRSFQ
jgi:hypothetical protein